MDKILFFCRFPPPYNSGQTIGTKLVFDVLSTNYQTSKVNLSYSGENIVGRSFIREVVYIFFVFSKLLQLILKLPKCTVLYIVPGMSTQGKLRDVIAVFFAKLFGKKVVFHIRNANMDEAFASGWKKKVIGYFARKVDVFIFLSEFLADRMKHILPSGKIKVVPNSIDKSVILSDEEVLHKLQSKKSTEDKINILYVSNLIKTKGYIDLVEAICLLPKNELKQLHFHFVGGTENAEDYEFFINKIKEKDLQESITIHGILNDRSEIRALYTSGSIFILPTYFPLEAQPRSIIEAMNAGNAIITTRHASIPEYVFENENGVFVEKKCPEQIKDAMLFLVKNNKYIEYGKSSREIYKNVFSYEGIGLLLENIILELRNN